MKNKRIKQITYQDIKDIDLQKYGFGGWMKKNWANVAQTAGGIGLGIVGALGAPLTFGGSAALLGAGASMAMSGASGFKQTADQDAAIAQQNAATEEQNQLSRVNALNQQIQQQPTAKYGGRLKRMRNGGELGMMEYGGLTHEQGGVNVDSTGTPVGNSTNNAVAEVEKDEVVYDGYIFSDKLMYNKNMSFAKKAKRVSKQFPNNPDTIESKTKEKLMNDLIAAQDKTREYLGLEEQVDMMRNGGGLPKYFTGGGIYPPKNIFYDEIGNPTQNQLELNMSLRDSNVRDPNSMQKVDVGKMADLPVGTTQHQGTPYGAPTLDLGNVPNFNIGNAPMFMNTNQQGLNYTPSNPAMSKQQGMYNLPKTKLNFSNSETTKTTKPKGTPYGGLNWRETALTALPGIAGGITNLVRAGNLKKNAPSKLSLARVMAEKIDNSRAIQNVGEQADVASTNIRRGLRESGNMQQYLQAMADAETGVRRGAGQQQGQLYENQENTNAQMRQQAAAQNAELSAQEQMYNNQLQAQHDAQVRGMQSAGISQIGQGVTGALTSKFQSARDADYMNMINPNYYIGVDNPSQWAINPRKRLISRT